MTTILQQPTVRLRTGVEMSYVEQGRAGASELVVALHGWPDSWFTFSRVTPVVNATWRGRSRTPCSWPRR